MPGRYQSQSGRIQIRLTEVKYLKTSDLQGSTSWPSNWQDSKKELFPVTLSVILVPGIANWIFFEMTTIWRRKDSIYNFVKTWSKIAFARGAVLLSTKMRQSLGFTFRFKIISEKFRRFEMAVSLMWIVSQASVYRASTKHESLAQSSWLCFMSIFCWALSGFMQNISKLQAALYKHPLKRVSEKETMCAAWTTFRFYFSGQPLQQPGAMLFHNCS